MDEQVELMDDEDTLPFLSDSWFDDDTSSTPNLQPVSCGGDPIPRCNLEMDMLYLGDQSVYNPTSSLEDIRQSLQRRLLLVHKWMGSMALCRGANGDILREAGAIHALLSLLNHLIPHLQQDELVVDLSTSILGALRDLACGSSLNRYAIGSFQSMSCHGMEIIASFVIRKHHVSWNDIVSTDKSSSKELRLLTTACSVIRNAAHSNRANSDMLQAMGLTQLLIWRLLHGSYRESDIKPHKLNKLPDASMPWREACFRIASALVNMAENNSDCAVVCASDDALVELLLTSWDDHLFVDDDDHKHEKINKGRSIPLLHPGLANILAQWNILNDKKGSKLSVTVEGILVREEKRKVAARLREQTSSLHVKVPKND